MYFAHLFVALTIVEDTLVRKCLRSTLFIHLSHQNNGACMGERMWAQICAHIAKGQYAAGWHKAYSRFRADHCNSIRMIVSRWKHDGWIEKSDLKHWKKQNNLFNFVTCNM